MMVNPSKKALIPGRAFLMLTKAAGAAVPSYDIEVTTDMFTIPAQTDHAGGIVFEGYYIDPTKRMMETTGILDRDGVASIPLKPDSDNVSVIGTEDDTRVWVYGDPYFREVDIPRALLETHPVDPPGRSPVRATYCWVPTDEVRGAVNAATGSDIIVVSSDTMALRMGTGDPVSDFTFTTSHCVESSGKNKLRVAIPKVYLEKMYFPVGSKLCVEVTPHTVCFSLKLPIGKDGSVYWAYTIKECEQDEE